MGNDIELGAGGKVAFGAACCVLPMLVIAGALPVSALIVGGIVMGAGSAVLALAALVGTSRVRTTRTVLRLALFAAGGAGAFAGLWGVWAGRREGATIVVAAIAMLAAAALLALADAQPRNAI